MNNELEKENLPYPQIKNKGVLDLGNGKSLRVYVLEDGRRVIDERDIENFFEMPIPELIKLANRLKEFKF